MKPACMSDADYALWLEAEKAYRSFGNSSRRSRPPQSPCHDCLPDYAADMRRVDRCDGLYPGEPGYIPPSHAPHETPEARLEARRRTQRESEHRRRAARRVATA